LIRKYGYFGTPETLRKLKENKELEDNLSAAAHLIHGSSEGRFSITYCPGHLTRQEIESVNFRYAPQEEMLEKYNPGVLKDGFNITTDGEEIYYISNPAIGLWACRERLEERVKSEKRKVKSEKRKVKSEKRKVKSEKQK
jgi:hypothetical protein